MILTLQVFFSMRNRKGIGLVVLVSLVALAGVVLMPASLLIANSASEMQLKIDKIKAYNAACAGVMRALYQWCASNATEASRRYPHYDVTFSGTNIRFKTGEPGNFAYFTFNVAETANWFVSGANRRLRQFRLRNIHNTSTSPGPSGIIATHAIVKWDPPGTALLNDIRFGNLSVIPAGGPFASGTELVLSNTDANRTRTSGQVWSGTNTYLQWSAALPDPVRVTVVWKFKDNGGTPVTDSSTHEVVFWDGCQTASNCDGLGTPLGLSPLHTFSITSTGAVQQSGGNAFPVKKSIRATVSGTPAGQNAEIIDWREDESYLF